MNEDLNQGGTMSIPTEQRTDERILAFWAAHTTLSPEVEAMNKGCLEELIDAIEHRAPQELLEILRSRKIEAREDWNKLHPSA